MLLVLVLALVVGWALGGSLDALGRLPLRGLALVALALAAQVAGAVLGGAAYLVGLVAGAVLALAFLVRNRGARGTGLVGLGLAANALVVGLNGAMPVSVGASDRAGVTTLAIAVGDDPRHALLGPGTRLALLGDVVPVPLPRAPQVVSPGDVLVAAGLGQLVVLGMRRGRPLPWRRDRPRPARPPLED